MTRKPVRGYYEVQTAYARRVPYERCLRSPDAAALARWLLYLHRFGEPHPARLDANDLAVGRRALYRLWQGEGDPARDVADLLDQCADYVREELEALCAEGETS